MAMKDSRSIEARDAEHVDGRLDENDAGASERIAPALVPAGVVFCLWCGETLTFGPPWRHDNDGAFIRTRLDADGRTVDDHVATPDRRR